MSFASEQKLDIMSHELRSNCCKRAYIEGIISASHTLDGEDIVLSLDSLATAEYVAKLIHDMFSKDSTIYSPKQGGRVKLLRFTAKSVLSYLTAFFEGKTVHTAKCPMCRSAYLRGVFLASGRVSDPSKQYLLEFSVKSCQDRFVDLFEEMGLTPRVSVKPRESVIYFKRSDEIEDFFATAGMNQANFALMNAKIQSELRNNANRIANCETNNIDRAVTSSIDIVHTIRELMSRGMLSQLPDELEATARMRVEFPDLSLSQLAARITPPVTKSGLSHRLKRISDMAKTILERKK